MSASPSEATARDRIRHAESCAGNRAKVGGDLPTQGYVYGGGLERGKALQNEEPASLHRSPNPP